jgi:hypothetical protein
MNEFEDPEPLDQEIVILRPGEAAPAETPEEPDSTKVVLSKDEYEALRKGSDSSSAIVTGLKDLAGAMRPGQQPANIDQKPGESEADFEKRLEAEMFEQGKAGKVISEAITRQTRGTLGALIGIMSDQNKQLVELNPSTATVFTKYKGEIENYVSSLPANQKNNPLVWTQAVNEIKRRHQDDIIEETVNSKVQERIDAEVNKRLAEYGIDPGAPAGDRSTARPRASMVSGALGGRSANVTTGTERPRTKVYATEEDIRNAQMDMIPIEEYMSRKGGK